MGEMTPDYDIETIRMQLCQLVRQINWHKCRGTMPYDWDMNGHKNVVALCRLLHVSTEGQIKVKDKRGVWR